MTAALSLQPEIATAIHPAVFSTTALKILMMSVTLSYSDAHLRIVDVFQKKEHATAAMFA